jgi:DNA-directed RNA polymerase I, II, and III subunit RPABC1
MVGLGLGFHLRHKTLLWHPFAKGGMDGPANRLSEEGSKLFRVRKTVLKMLQNRGYIISSDSLNMSADDFAQRYGETPNREEMDMMVERADDASDQLFVFYPQDEKVGVKPVRTYGDRMMTEGVKRCIIVVRGGMTPFARSATQELCAQRGFQVEDFREAELMVDITEHVLVPKHELLSKEEKEELLKRYKLNETQLPRIQTSDPVARYYGLQRGNVVRITRPSETAGRYITYRLCI